MRYIDKFRNHKRAHSINVRFLQDCYANDLPQPVPRPDNPSSSFDDFKKPQYRDSDDGWKSLLYEEQDQRCCYCMRKLGVVNYEHVIPRSITSSDAEDIRYYMQHAQALHDFVEISDVFAAKNFSSISDIQNEKRMPHIVALSNLLVACNGKLNSQFVAGCCCNNHRGDRRMMPIMLRSDCDEVVKYDENGILRIDMDDDTLKDLMTDLNDETLQEIRAIWNKLSTTERLLSDVGEYSLKERIEWFKDAYGTDDFSLLPESVKRYVGFLSADNSAPDFYWNILLDYDWFYMYYKSKNNNIRQI